MNVICPADPAHAEFVTTQYVLEEVIIDQAGDFVARGDFLEVTEAADPDNSVFICRTCGAEATATA